MRLICCRGRCLLERAGAGTEINTQALSSLRLQPADQQPQLASSSQPIASQQASYTSGQPASGQPRNRDQQKWAGYDPSKEGSAAATSAKAQAALEAVARGPTNKTNPDKDDDHDGFGATDTGPGAVDRGTKDLTGSADAALKGSWLTQLIGKTEYKSCNHLRACHVQYNACSAMHGVRSDYKEMSQQHLQVRDAN